MISYGYCQKRGAAAPDDSSVRSTTRKLTALLEAATPEAPPPSVRAVPARA